MNNALYSRSSGQGLDLVLPHGLCGQGTNLRSVARALQANFRVHCLLARSRPFGLARYSFSGGLCRGYTGLDGST